MHLSSLSKYANKGPCSTWLLTVFLHAAYKYDAIGPSVRLDLITVSILCKRPHLGSIVCTFHSWTLPEFICLDVKQRVCWLTNRLTVSELRL